MALAEEQEWAMKVRKYGGGIDLGKTTKDELAEFVETKIYMHEKEDFSDNTLWTVFREEFKEFTLEDFRKMRSDTRAKLRKHLLKRGVCIAKHNARITLSNILFDII
jgi:hypothetical protein